jgi:hypothetical protein
MNRLAEGLKLVWQARLLQDLPQAAIETRQAILRWLLGEELEQLPLDPLAQKKLAIVQQKLDYRYRTLQQRYLNVEPTQAYRHLLARTGSVMVLHPQISSWIALKGNHRTAVMTLLHNMIEDLLRQDPYIQRQMAWIAQCSADVNLRNALLLSSLEEYCLSPKGNQPRLIYLLVNFWQRQWQEDEIKKLQHEIVYLLCEKVYQGGGKFRLPVVNSAEKYQMQRIAVQEGFENYLAEQGTRLESSWLRLYLQGRSQEAIAQLLNLPLKEVYQLKETVTHRAIQIFSIQKLSALLS